MKITRLKSLSGFPLFAIIVLLIIGASNYQKVWYSFASLFGNLYLLLFEQNISYFFTDFFEYWIAVLYLIFSLVLFAVIILRKFSKKQQPTRSGYIKTILKGALTEGRTKGWLIFLYILISIGLMAPLLTPMDPYDVSNVSFLRNREPLCKLKYVLMENIGLWKFSDKAESNIRKDIIDYKENLTGVSSRVYFDSISYNDNFIRFHQNNYNYDVPVIQMGALHDNISRQTFLLGTDIFGRDLLSRIIYGTRISLSIGFLALIISMMIGIPIGLFSGYTGGITDSILMRFIDIILSFPILFLILLIIALFGNSIFMIILFLGLTTWMDIARLVRTQVMSIKNENFILSANALGFTKLRILFNHILPNIMTAILINAVFRIGNIILSESALSFLGIGVQAPIASWGNIINEGKDYIISAWWISLFPGILITLTVLSFNYIGERMRSSLERKV